MFAVAVMATLLVIVVLVLLRKVERMFVSRRRLFHYSLKTTDAPQSLTRLLEILEREGLQLDDFRIREVSDGVQELHFAVVTSLEGNSRLIGSLSQIGTQVEGSTTATSE